MKKTESLLERRKACLCLLTALCVISLYVIIFPGGNSRESGADSYTVTIRHYGVDAAEMERSAAIPLEDAFSLIPGVISVQSSSENSMTRVFVCFSRGAGGQYKAGHYNALREAAQRVYETLPQSAQRPEIQGSDNSRIPVWSAAVSGTGNSDAAISLEKIIKPRLESLEGAGEVLVSGHGPREIIIAMDQEKAAALGLPPSRLASIMGMNDALFPAGLLAQGETEIILTVDGRYGFDDDTDDFLTLGDMPIPIGGGRIIPLSEIASIYEQERRPEIISRINGKNAALISVMAGSGADLGKLSKNIQKELADTSLPFEFTVLSDRGAEETAALRSVFGAAIQGALMVAVIGFLLNRRKGINCRPSVNIAGFFCAMSVPAVCLFSAALLSACGLPPNRGVLAGISAGVGTAVDSVILCSEKLKHCKNYDEARSSLSLLRGPLIAGSATTVAALLPIPAMGQGDAGIISISIAAVTLAALILSLGPLPPLLLWGLHEKTDHQVSGSGTAQIAARIAPRIAVNRYKILRNYSRVFVSFAAKKTRRFLALNVRLCVQRPRALAAAGALVTVAGLTALWIRGVDSGTYGSGNSVYAHVEFEGGLLAQEADRLLAAYGESLASGHGIVNVQTAARTGSGSILIAFDPKIISVEKAREFARRIPIPGAFLFFPETAARERYWEIKIFGDDDRKCREIAEDLARSLAAYPLVKERILNFKQGSRRLDLFPDREKFAAFGLAFSGAADSLRRGVHGPVAYKRISSRGETDVRLRLNGDPSGMLSGSQTMNILISSPRNEEGHSGSFHIDSLFTTEEGYEPSSIRREDRRRTASITVVTKPADPRRVKKHLAAPLAAQDLPAGYSIEFDPEAIRRAEALSGTALFFLLALLFCYMVMAAVNESFLVPFAVLFAVPPSLAVPAVILAIAGFPFNAAAACAFVAVSGMTVNAAVLCAGNLKPAGGGMKRRLYYSLRRNLPVLAATTATTIAGAIPFLFLREGANVLVRTMALVTALGVGSSCLCAISAVPAMLMILRKNNRLVRKPPVSEQVY